MLHRLELAMGNLFTQCIDEVLLSEVASLMQSLSVDNTDGCSDCVHKYLCGGGCRARSLYRYGDLSHRDSYCTLMNTYYSSLNERLKG